MNSINFKAIPTFRISDYNAAKEFYVTFLGFTVDWEHRFGNNEPVYMQISKNGLIIHLSENVRFQKGVIVFVETTGIENFHCELINIENKFSIPKIEKTNWGTIQMEIKDPFENLLRFNEIIPANKK